MSQYKVTIKVTETYIYETDDATCEEDAIAQAFRDRHYWSCEYDNDEFEVVARPQEGDEE